MQSSGTGLHRAPIRRQSGSVAMLGALWLMIAVICLATIDIGNVFWQKRELQKIADLAALAGASVTQMKDCSASAQQNALQNGAVSQEVKAECGNWSKSRTGATAGDMFIAGQDPFNASRVQISRSVPFLFVWQATGASARTVDANAVAWRAQPAAALTIRSTLLKVDTKQSPILNAILGGLLGSSINLDAVGWNGLVNTQINLLQFLDFLAPRIGLNLGDYDKLVNADVSVGVLLQAMVDAVQQSGNTASVGVQALNQLITAALGVPAVKLKLSQLLNLQSGLDSSALDLGLNVFDLVQGAIQVGNSNSAVSAAVAVPLPGLLNLNVFLKVIELPQLSSIGDPQLAKLDPLGPNRIYVRTAQVRLLVSIDTPVLGGLFHTLDAVLKPLTFIVINLINLISGITDGPADLTLFPPSTRLDLSVDVGGGAAYVTDYDCSSGSKKLIVNSRTAIADIRLGKLGDSLADAKSKAFSSHEPVSMAALPIFVVDCLKCDTRGFVKQYYGGLGIKVDAPVGEYPAAKFPFDKLGPFLDFSDPPKIEDFNVEPQWKSIKAENIIGSLTSTLKGVDLLQPLASDSAAKKNLVNGIVEILKDTLGGVISTLISIVQGILSPLLDPLINGLLKTLGIDIAETQVGARMTCGLHPELVY